jgi:signal transduction histidine kinase
MNEEQNIRSQLEELSEDLRRRLCEVAGFFGDLNSVADQLAYAVADTFDFTVKIDSDDSTVQKLCIVMNFFLETIRRTLRELEDGHRKILESERLKSQFVSNVSHELRTPLTLLLAPLESILAGEYGAVPIDQQPLLQTMHNNAIRLLQMINGLLDFSKLEAGKIEVNPEPTELVQLTRVALADFATLITNRGQSCTLICKETVIWAKIDRYLYERILFNLLSNAVKFTPPGGRLTVSLALRDNQLELSVADTGIGIRPEHLHAIFTRFHQIENPAERRFEGSGLGLPLVKEFAELMGGLVSVESQISMGSKFTVTFPYLYCQPVEVTDQTSRRDSKPVQAHGVSLVHHGDDELTDRPKVLIAEDNLELGTYIASLLHGICNTRIAVDGEQTLEIVHQWIPDLVLADVMMPGRTGLEVCREIKTDPATNHIPVVLLTALTHRDAMLQGWEAGADDYLFKPFHPKELISRTRTILDATRSRTQAKESMKHAYEQALESSRFKSEFLARMSHEIRTPMNAVIGMLDLMLRGQLSESQRDEATVAFQSAQSLLDIINEILDFSKIEAGKLELEEMDFDVMQLVEGTAELVAEQARRKGLALTVFVDAGVPRMLRGDPGRLRQVLFNLLGNGIKFTDKGEVLLRATTNESRTSLILVVEDTGIGLSPAAIQRLFQPFVQADGSITRRYGGTGLGLSISRRLTELMGGTINVDSVEGKGSTFTVVLPLKAAIVAVPLSAAPEVLHGVKLLYVGGTPCSAEAIRSYSESWGVSTTTAATAAEAISVLRDAVREGKPYPVAILDEILADRHVFVLASILKEEADLASTRLVLLAAQSSEQVSRQSAGLNFAATLSRPLRQSRLAACLVDVLEAGQLRTPKVTPSAGALDHAFAQVPILVAEDNPANQKLIALQLKKLGYTALCVNNGREAVEAADRIACVLIFMDVMMPEVDGLQATLEIRRKEMMKAQPPVPIVALTAHAMPGDRDRCLAVGMDDYLSKPITLDRLKEVLQRWIPQTEWQPPDELHRASGA